VPRDIVGELPERLQELLGYNIYPPFAGYSTAGTRAGCCRQVPSHLDGWVWFAGPMPIAASFRSRLVAREPLYGAWSVIPSALSVRLLAVAGLDYVVIDLQHGGATEADLPALTSAIRLAGAAPVGRVRHAHAADIGRALDLGCEGVIVPNVDSAAQARRVAGAVRYPPTGYRSAGGVLAVAEPFCLVMVETADAVAELDATLAGDGVDGLYVGPRDLSLSLGCALDPDDPVLRSALQRVWEACAAAGKPVGVHAYDGAVARRYREAGCTLITTTADASAITRDTAAQFSQARA
jgi:4-hydroxy-2-oxoheptanedioate aldolase